MNAQDQAPALSTAQLIGLAFKGLGVHAMRAVTLVMAFALFGGAVWYPDWRRTVTAAAFSLIVLPIVWLRKEATHGG